MQVRKQQLELDIEKHIGTKLEKAFVNAVYCHSAYLTYMQSWAGGGTRWNQDCQEKYQ